MARGGTQWHGAARHHVYIYTFTRSYCAIPLPRFVQTGSRVQFSFVLFFKILSRRMPNIIRCTLWIISHSSNHITWIFIKYNISYYISNFFCDCDFKKKCEEEWHGYLSVRTVSQSHKKVIWIILPCK